MANPQEPSSLHQEYPWHLKNWDNFINARTQNHLPHAILLSGEEGIGKLALAKRMAKSLLCMNTMEDACNECQSCKTYTSEANPDYKQISLLEDKQQIGVDQIRALSEFLNYSRSYNTYRVVIINPVERMNINAANSLLKSLEEPTANTVIILITAQVSKLLATIKSRCQLFNVTSPSKEESISWIKQNQHSDENSNIDVNTIYDMIGNKPLQAQFIKQENIDSKNHFLEDLHYVITQKTSINEMAKKWDKHDLEVIINWQVQEIQKHIKSSVIDNSKETQSKNSSSRLAQHLSTEEQWLLYQNLLKQKQYIHTSVNSLMFIENMILLWSKAR